MYEKYRFAYIEHETRLSRLYNSYYYFIMRVIHYISMNL